ncbi:integumentary mucin C.1-like [Rhagoletis pomonella]|uniref:integumentary mucin C.1-like n=1 Tax=Rhagoletis pomonella TaxID=28610 RepID=UPI001785B5F4|nr:integumentary mucin C.1-like [Rhagoletis pomonella]
MGGLFNQFTTNVESLVKGTVDNIVDCFDKLFGGMNGKKRGPHSTLPDPYITNTTTTSTTSTTTSTTSTSTSTTSTSTSTTSTSTSTTSTTTPTPSTVAAGAGGAGRNWGMGGLFNQFTTNVESLVKGTVDNIVDCFDKLFGGMNGKKRGPHSTLPDPNITNTTTTSTTSTTTSTTSTSTSTTSTSTSTTSTSTSTTSTTTPTPSTVAAGAGGAGRKNDVHRPEAADHTLIVSRITVLSVSEFEETSAGFNDGLATDSRAHSRQVELEGRGRSDDTSESACTFQGRSGRKTNGGSCKLDLGASGSLFEMFAGCVNGNENRKSTS